MPESLGLSQSHTTDRLNLRKPEVQKEKNFNSGTKTYSF